MATNEWSEKMPARKVATRKAASCKSSKTKAKVSDQNKAVDDALSASRELDRELAKMGPFTDPAEDEDEDGNVDQGDETGTVET